MKIKGSTHKEDTAIFDAHTPNNRAARRVKEGEMDNPIITAGDVNAFSQQQQT
jgi:hypothetical protein